MLVACGGLGAWSAAAQVAPEKKTILWILNDFPPFILVDRDLPGDGFVDAALKHVIANLPDYNHRFEVAGVARAQGLMAQGTPVCHPALLKTPEREKLADFSQPAHFVLTHQVVLKKKDLPRFQRHIRLDGKVDVDTLMADSSLVTSVTEGRALGPKIDAPIAAHRGATHIKTTGVHFDAPFRQLASGWTDYIFAYPVEPAYYKIRHDIAADGELTYLPIAGTPDFTLGHFTCSKGPWGHEVIQRINRALQSAGPRPHWVDVQLSHMDTTARERFEHLFALHKPFQRARSH